jgi:agmatinase
LPPEYSDPESSEFVVFTAPFEKTTSYRKGAALGPNAILEASHQVELFDFEMGRSAVEKGIATDRSMDVFCDGDYERYDSAARAAALAAMRRGAAPVFIGGEHSISLAPAAAALELYPDLTVVQIDAHADLRDSYDGDRYSHASVMRRILDIAPGPARLVQVGIRSGCAEEFRLAESESRISMFTAAAIHSGRVSIDDILDGVKGPVYLTIDLDGIDPAEAPAVGTPEPGGLSWRWTLEFIERLCALSKPVAFDLVELCPIPGDFRSDFLCAKLIYRIIGLIAAQSK